MKDCEPVFPPISVEKEIISEIYPGVTIRDYFAAAAMQGFLSNPQLAGAEPHILAKDAYDYADAMLKERERKP